MDFVQAQPELSIEVSKSLLIVRPSTKEVLTSILSPLEHSSPTTISFHVTIDLYNTTY